MPKGSSKSTSAIERLLEERRQYEAWIARIDAAGDAAPLNVRTRVRADYVARLGVVMDELKAHIEAARQMTAQRRATVAELEAKEKQAAERLSEAELRHAVGEYDEAQWTQIHKDALAELVAVREELQSVQADIAKLEELDQTVAEETEGGAPGKPAPRAGPPPRPEKKDGGERKKAKPAAQPVDELTFLKSVTEDSAGHAPSPKRASGAQYQVMDPIVPGAPAEPGSAPAGRLGADDDEPEAARTLKCRDCGTMNLPTEWYCESCGAELAAL